MKIFQNFFLSIAFCLVSSALAFGQTGGGVEGKIRNNKGEGIGGATVTARLNGEDVKTTKADAKGNFSLTGLEPGTYNLVFEKSGYSAGVRYNVEIRPGAVIDLGDRLILGLDPGTQVIVKGSVFDQNGRSVPGAKVEIQRINGDGSTKKIGSGKTSESGEFTFRFPEASAKFRVVASLKGTKASKDIEVDSAMVYRLAITLDLSK